MINRFLNLSSSATKKYLWRAPAGHATAPSQPYGAPTGRSPAPALLCRTRAVPITHTRGAPPPPSRLGIKLKSSSTIEIYYKNKRLNSTYHSK